MDNELKEEFEKIEKMNSHERLCYIRELVSFKMMTDDTTLNRINSEFYERLLYITKGYEDEGKGALLPHTGR